MSNDIFTGIFGIEFILKILGMGFIVGNGTYLKNTWNILDFIVVCLGIMSYIP